MPQTRQGSQKVILSVTSTFPRCQTPFQKCIKYCATPHHHHYYTHCVRGDPTVCVEQPPAGFTPPAPAFRLQRILSFHLYHIGLRLMNLLHTNGVFFCWFLVLTRNLLTITKINSRITPYYKYHEFRQFNMRHDVIFFLPILYKICYH